MEKLPNLTQELESLKIEVEKLRNTMNLNFNLIGSRVENAIKTANKKPKETRLIPFDIEKAKQGAKVVTRDGCDVRVLCYDSIVNKGGPIVAETYGDSIVTLATYSENGAYIDGEISDHDLMIKEEG